MPRCNLTLKQKSQIIELSSELNTEQLAKRFRVHPTTVTRTLKKQAKILGQAARVNPNFKTVQTNFKSEQHDTLVIAYIQNKQLANEPINVNDVCDKAVDYANDLGRQIKSKRAWWRRFKVRCNIIKSKIVKNSLGVRQPQKNPTGDESVELQEQDPQKAQQEPPNGISDLKKKSKRVGKRRTTKTKLAETEPEPEPKGETDVLASIKDDQAAVPQPSNTPPPPPAERETTQSDLVCSEEEKL